MVTQESPGNRSGGPPTAIRVWAYESAPAAYRDAAALPENPQDEMAFLAVLSAEYTRPAQMSLRHFLFGASRDCTCTFLPDGSAIYVGTLPEQPTTYERLGGEAGLKKVVARVCERLLTDPVLAARFRALDLPGLQDRITTFVGAVLGGPQTYDGPGLDRIRDEAPLPPAEADLIVQHLTEALREFDLPPLTIADTVATLGPLRHRLAEAPPEAGQR